MNDVTHTMASADFREQHRQYLLECAKRRASALQTLPAQLAAFGVAVVTAGYSGCGDSGQFDDISYLTAANAAVTAAVPGDVREQVETLLYDTLEARHGGWENNDGAEGEFRWTLASNHFEQLHRNFYTECYTTEHKGFEDLTAALPKEAP
jgi:hypothetical protein